MEAMKSDNIITVTSPTNTSIISASPTDEEDYFTTSGIRVNHPQHGITIIRDSDGHVIKASRK